MAYPYARQVAAAAKRHGVPFPVLQGLLLVENPSGARGAVSSTGDVGPAQINLRYHPGVSRAQAENPAYAINWAAAYLRGLYDHCGSWQGALTQYNHGTALGCQPSAYSRKVLDVSTRYRGGAQTAPYRKSAGAATYLLLGVGAALLLALVLR